MKERPILFSGPMVRAILDGRKTQTRRVVKMKSKFDDIQTAAAIHPDGSGQGWIAWWGETAPTAEVTARMYPGNEGFACPHGTVGDRLYVRETWRVGAWSQPNLIAVDYMADGRARKEWLECDNLETFDRLLNQCIADISPVSPDDDKLIWQPGNSPCRMRPSIHMPRWESRIDLEITRVWVERLRDICEEDAKQEGVDFNRNPSAVSLPGANTAKEAFCSLWESIYGPGSWDSNPFVWVLEFKRVGA